MSLVKNKIYVYAISKNEEKFVDRWMDSLEAADAVYVLDTGSTDNTVQKFRSSKRMFIKSKRNQTMAF